MSSIQSQQPYLAIQVSRSGGPVRVLLHGEAEVSSHARLQDALDAIAVDGAESVRIDVSGLSFCDAGSLQRLLRFARRARMSGREVTTTGAGATFRRSARLLGADRDLGLV
jgi:anti-anti-sigma regulatory factor